MSYKPPALAEPKHGKEDAKNEPHVRVTNLVSVCCHRKLFLCERNQVGGSIWAGGTGGSNTAGLGGRGGPYRLDKGHPVHQAWQFRCCLLPLPRCSHSVGVRSSGSR